MLCLSKAAFWQFSFEVGRRDGGNYIFTSFLSFCNWLTWTLFEIPEHRTCNMQLNLFKENISSSPKVQISTYLQNFLSTMWYMRPGAYNLLGSLSFLPSGMKVSLKHIRNIKQGKLSKGSRPGIRDNNNNSLLWQVKELKGLLHPPKGDKETNQKIDLNISSNGVGVLGKKSSWKKSNEIQYN